MVAALWAVGRAAVSDRCRRLDPSPLACVGHNRRREYCAAVHVRASRPACSSPHCVEQSWDAASASRAPVDGRLHAFTGAVHATAWRLHATVWRLHATTVRGGCMPLHGPARRHMARLHNCARAAHAHIHEQVHMRMRNIRMCMHVDLALQDLPRRPPSSGNCQTGRTLAA